MLRSSAIRFLRAGLVRSVGWLATRPLLTLLSYVLAAFAMRWFSLRASVIDWDETTDLLDARALLQGHSLYAEVWDFKPPGIFWLLTGLEALFDDAIVPLRVLGALLVAGSAYCLNRTLRLIAPAAGEAAFMGGLLFVSTLSFNGFSNAIGRGLGLEVNTEHFFIFFTCLAFWIGLRGRDQPVRLLLAGLTLGAGFVVKYFVLVDFVLLAYAIAVWPQPGGRLRWLHFPGAKRLAGIAMLSIGFALPWLLAAGWFYAFSGHWDAFRAVTFHSGSGYASSLSALRALRFAADLLYLGGVTSLCMLAALVQALGPARQLREGRIAKLLLLWLAADFLAVCLPGKFFLHYLYQCFPPLCLLAGLLFSPALLPKEIARRRWLAAVTGFVLLCIPVVAALKIHFRFGQPDMPRRVATYIERHADPQRPIYVFNYPHVVYYLTDRLPPTRYVHPSILSNPQHAQAAGVDIGREWERIFELQPQYVVYATGSPHAEFEARLSQEYRPEKKFPDGAMVYARKSG